MMRRWRGGDQVLVRMGGDALTERVTWVRADGGESFPRIVGARGLYADQP